jgi:lactoylglutathione lyase
MQAAHYPPVTATSRSASNDIDATLEQPAEQGIHAEKPPYQIREGGSRLAFVRDPDDYRIELIGAG